MVVGTLGVRPRLPDPPYWRVSLDAGIKVSRGRDKTCVVPLRDNRHMGREDRMKEARRQAAANAPERDARLAAQRGALRRKTAAIGADEAQNLVSRAERDSTARFLGPNKTPAEWRLAIDIARDVTIEAAKRDHTITYGEIKFAVWQQLDMLVGYSMFANLVMSVNRKSDDVLPSSIIVHKDDGRPGAGFRPYAISQGFDEPIETSQRHVFEHFSGSG